ncbi:MAG: hypothetical protein IJR91_08890 [Ruminococcus sp.]|nr:hypothetical protein [Ruminococcus sp.]
MKERELYKEVMKRGFEPDFDNIASRITETASERPSVARLKPKWTGAAAAVFAAAIGLGVAAALMTSHFHKAELGTAPEDSISASQYGEDTSQGPLCKPDKPAFIVFGNKVYYNDEDHFDENNKYNKYIEGKFGSGKDVPTGSPEITSFLSSKQFLGVVKKYDGPGEENTGEQLETNLFPVGSAVFKEKDCDILYVYVQNTTASASVYEFGIRTPFQQRPLGKTIFLEDTGEEVQDVLGGTVRSHEFIENPDGPDEENMTIELDRNTLYDPTDTRFSNSPYPDNTILIHIKREIPQTLQSYKSTHYCYDSRLDDLKEGAYVYFPTNTPGYEGLGSDYCEFSVAYLFI